MKWSNLKTMQCPDCGKSLKDKAAGYCCECGFCISYEKFRSVINNIYKSKPRHYDADSVDRSDWN